MFGVGPSVTVQQKKNELNVDRPWHPSILKRKKTKQKENQKYEEISSETKGAGSTATSC